MHKIIPFIILLQLLVFASEPSVYGAGNLDSSNPYGLSQSEKKILENIKDIKTLQKNIKILQLNYSDLKDRFSGLRSVTESISDKIGKIDKKMYMLDAKDDNISSSIKNLQDEITSIKEDLNSTIQTQNTNQEKVKNVLSELSNLIDSINSSYVSKDEFQKFVSSIENKLSTIKKSSKSDQFAGKKRSDLENSANELLKQKSYDEAKKIFSFLVEKKYHPAGNSFKLGEIAYAQKSYKEAIVHYKKSISLYDKASYIPTLLYHTGISLSKLKKNNEAAKFFKALKTNYPNSREAKSLKK
ncbi:MAG: tetratricopeptide repeat protein [Sulfurospirillaceae bacterium]|nr:tetratricopeptide repeat protein [Sulfurospirillaceae bacterium]